MAHIEARSIVQNGWALTVRCATAEDAAATLTYMAQIYCETEFLAREPGEFQMSLDDQRRHINDRLANPNDLVLVALVDEQIIGSLGFTGSTLKRFCHQGEFGMAVLNSHWGHRVGTALVETLLAWTRTRSIVRVSLEVAADNARAIRFYQRLGFEQEGRLKAHRRLGSRFVDSLVMARLEP